MENAMTRTNSIHPYSRIHGLLATLLFVLVCGQAQTLAQELPTFGKPLWTLNLDTLRARGAVDFASDVNQLFIGTRKGWVLVIDAESGVVTDSFSVRVIPRYRNLTGVLDVYSVRCSQDGRTLVVGVTSTRNPVELTCDIFVLEYPSWRVVDTLLYSKSDTPEPWDYSQFGISPSGRYLALPDSSWRDGASDWTLPRMKILDRSTGRSRVVTWAYDPILDFDSSESTIAYCEVVNTSRGYYMNYVRTLSLVEDTSTPQGWDVYGTPSLSSDGSKLMVSGYGRHESQEELNLLPHVTIYDMKTRDTIWHMRGDRTGNGSDLAVASWSKDCKHVLTNRASTKLVPPEWHGIVKYRVGEEKPFAKLDTSTWFVFRTIGQDRAGVGHPNLTRGYFVLNSRVLAFDYSPETTGSQEPGSAADDVIFPNPTSGSVTVSCKSDLPAVSWSVYTLSGGITAKGVLEDFAPDSQGVSRYQIHLAETLPPGKFLLTLQDRLGNNVCTYQMVTK